MQHITYRRGAKQRSEWRSAPGRAHFYKQNTTQLFQGIKDLFKRVKFDRGGKSRAGGPKRNGRPEGRKNGSGSIGPNQKGEGTLNIRQKHGVEALSKAIHEAENKRKGISGDIDKINKNLQVLMQAVNNPVPDKVIDDE